VTDSPSSAVHYVPILKGRAGELRALREMREPTASRLVPLVEVPVVVEDSESDDPNSADVVGDIGKFARDLTRNWRPGRPIIVDATLIPIHPHSIPTVDLINRLAQSDYTVIPTVRPSDPNWAINRIGEAIHEWRLGSACIRIGGDDLDDNERSLADAVDDAIAQLRLEPDHIDLVLDFGPVMDEQAMSFAARIARLVLSEMPYQDEWRTLVCAAGAFPPDLNSVQAEVLTELPRYDAAMWNVLHKRVRGRVPIFGDYAIAYPAQTAGVPFAPAPQLRFTAEASWYVMKGRKQDRKGARQFYDICARVAETGSVDSSLSWGDEYVDRAARSAANGPNVLVRTGNAMIWRAIGTSHHIAYVANRLATVGAP
jgi:hypothetical protein